MAKIFKRGDYPVGTKLRCTTSHTIHFRIGKLYVVRAGGCLRGNYNYHHLTVSKFELYKEDIMSRRFNRWDYAADTKLLCVISESRHFTRGAVYTVLPTCELHGNYTSHTITRSRFEIYEENTVSKLTSSQDAKAVPYIEYPCLRKGKETGTIYLYSQEGTSHPIILQTTNTEDFIGEALEVDIEYTLPFVGTINITQE